MPAQRNTFRLGLAIILFVVLFVGVVLYIGGGIGRTGQPFVVRFAATDLSAQLIAGGEVECGGQDVGTIQSISLRNEPTEDQADTLFVYVHGVVDPIVDLREDATITPGEPLLGNVAKLIIQNRGVGAPVDPDTPIDGTTVGTVNSAIAMISAQLDPDDPRSLLSMIKSELNADRPQSLLGKIHRSLADLNDITRSIRIQLDPQERTALLAKLHEVLDNINGATELLRNELDAGRNEAVLAEVHAALDTINESLATVTGMLEENRPVVRRSLAHVEGTARRLDEEISVRIADELNAQDAASLLGQVHKATELLNRSLDDLNTVTSGGATLLTAKKDELSKTFSNFLDTSEFLKAAAKEIYRNPWRLLYHPSETESRELNLFDATRAFADAATQLDNAVLRLKGVMEAKDGRLAANDAELQAIRDDLQQTYDKFHEAETALWKQLNVK